MTNESKRQADEQLWRSFLQMYVERLKQEGIDNNETKQSTVCKTIRIDFSVKNFVCLQNGFEKLSCTTSY